MPVILGFVAIVLAATAAADSSFGLGLVALLAAGACGYRIGRFAESA